MQIISMPRLRMAELQSFTESLLEICQDIPELQPAVVQVKSTFEPFKKGMLKEKVSGTNKKVLDKNRDRLLSGFFMNVKVEEFFPHENKEITDVLEKVIDISNKYGMQISRLPYNQETAAIDNLIAELGGVDLSKLNGSTLPRWIPLLERANNSFKSESQEYITNTAESENIYSATNLAPDVYNALENLFALLFAHGKISQREVLVKAYNELNKLVDTYK